MTYASSFGKGDYAADVGAGTLTTFNIFTILKLVDDVLGSGTKSGYNYVGGRVASTSPGSAQFFISTIPVSLDPLTRTGDRRLGVATDGVMRSDLTLDAQYPDAAAVMAAPPFSN